jgi:hypothetical protein
MEIVTHTHTHTYTHTGRQSVLSLTVAARFADKTRNADILRHCVQENQVFLANCSGYQHTGFYTTGRTKHVLQQEQCVHKQASHEFKIIKFLCQLSKSSIKAWNLFLGSCTAWKWRAFWTAVARWHQASRNWRRASLRGNVLKHSEGKGTGIFRFANATNSMEHGPSWQDNICLDSHETILRS